MLEAIAVAATMPGKIFVNYRRDDERAMAARIRDRLAATFGDTNVFMDVDNLMAGQRFDKELEKALGATDVFLAVIGPRWLQLLGDREKSGERDYVREEIAAALQRGIVVIPVLIEGTPLPRAGALPEDLRDLVLHQKHVVTHEQFGRDIAGLVEPIHLARKASKAGVGGGSSVARWAATSAVIALFVGGLAVYQVGVFGPGQEPRPGEDQAAKTRAAGNAQAGAVVHKQVDEEGPGAERRFPAGRAIEMTALFGAATASTQTARVLADGMAKVLGVPVLVLDKPGAGGAVGYMYLSQQKPDGHSLVWSSNSISTTFHNGQLPFDYKNLDHVARITVETPVLAVKADAPWKSLRELVEHAKANPDKVRVGNSGQGSQTHIASIALFTSVGAKVIPVHHTSGQAIAELLAGRIEVMVQFPQVVVPHVRSGELRVLALLGNIPDPVFPDVKSAKQLGYNIDMPLWRGISAPKGTPKALIAKLQDAAKKAVESAEFKDAAQKIGFTPAYQPSDAFTKMIIDGDALVAATIARIRESESR